MASRPAFIATKNDKLVEIINVEFEYFTGFAAVQKAKTRDSFHNAIREHGYEKILEVSTNSDNELGWQLSAFNLMTDYDGEKIPLECAFQGSKVFEYGGPYTDIFKKTNIEAKKDKRLKNSGKVIKFRYEGNEWETEPQTAFYDWLYISTVYKNYPHLIEELANYEVFTDIAFNPKKSVNCQAKSCAILVSLYHIGKLEEALSSKDNFLRIVYGYKEKPKQGSLF
ncbi:MAG: hypothetical protein ABGX26_01595 [Nautiliaceae bacterium]